MEIPTVTADTTAAIQAVSANASQEGAARTLAATKTSASATGLNAPPILNPASHINPALGIVVVETYNSSGTVIDRYPTTHMLQQYSLYGLSSDEK